MNSHKINVMNVKCRHNSWSTIWICSNSWAFLNRPHYPVINFPDQVITSFKVESGKNGYSFEYKANDPAILESDRSLQLDKNKRGWFGPQTEVRRELMINTLDGQRNIARKKHIAKSEQCISSGARSQGAMASTLPGIPYIGWLDLVGQLLGQEVGSEIGSEIGSEFNDCSN